MHIRSIREGGIWEYIGHQKLKRSQGCRKQG
nr:MAG TPA: hypothetical protein [Caudoviricetes sp.]